jgi:two-component system, OmpR family, response regulator
MAPAPIRILVVDDRAQDIALLARTIQALANDVEVVATAGSGAEALEITAPFDVAVVDYRMPEMDGLELATKLKERDPDVKIVILTAYSDTRDEVVGHPAVDELLEKLALDRIGDVLHEVTGRAERVPVKSGFFRRK